MFGFCVLISPKHPSPLITFLKKKKQLDFRNVKRNYCVFLKECKPARMACIFITFCASIFQQRVVNRKVKQSRWFMSGSRGGGVKVSLTIAFFLVLSLFYRSQMVNFKAIYHFSRFQRGSNIFQGGSNFFQGGGSNCLYPIETHKTCDFQGEYGPPAPPPPLWIRTCGFRLFLQATILIHRRLTCISFLTGLYLECEYEDLRCLRN